MMVQVLRLALFGLVGMTVLYVLISVYSRSVRREKLEKQWDEGDGTGEREAFIREGMEAYRHSLRRKLIWGVYVVPVVAVSILIYVLNFG